METIFKTFRAEVKEINEEDGTVDMFIPVSTDSIDRDGEVVEPTAFRKTLPKFMKRPVLVSSHDYRDLTSQIGEWTKLKIDETGLHGKPKYYVNEGNEQADWGFKLAAKGVAAFSIGFIPKVWDDGDGAKEPRRTYKEVELLEISQVIVPSNREAIQSIRSKSVDPIINKICDEVEKELEEKELVTKPEENDNTIRIPVDRSNHDDHNIRTISISTDEGIKALYCVTDKLIMTYLFDKSKGWTMDKAKKWVKDHEKSIILVEAYETLNEIEKEEMPTEKEHPEKKEDSQDSIIDEIDYLATLIDKNGMNDEVIESLKELLKRLPADDIAVEEKDIDKDEEKEFLLDLNSMVKKLLED